ncbi:pentapeptide repeat-containing protein, partial [Rothia aeria]
MASPSAPTSPMKDNAGYILAVEQLAHGAFAERRAAADTLVGLADDWLSNATISAAERDAAAQVVADALCAYIRTPLPSEQEAENPRNTGENPPEKERSFSHGEGPLNEGAEGALRQHILEAIHQRVRWHLNPGEQVGEYETPLQAQTTPGPWSHLVFDFTGAIFCHPVDFTGSHWGRTVSFAGCTFTEAADFSSSFYEGDATFEGATYRLGAGFVQCVYHQDVRHTGSVYRTGAEF